MAINIGSLAGIILVPIVAQQNITLAYCLPVSLLGMAICLFLSGTPRYVMSKPRGALFGAGRKGATESPKQDNSIPLSTIFRITALTIPFNIAYSQMPTTFIVQGTVMRKAFGVIDVATMNSLDAVSVLFFGSVTGNIIYPALARRNIRIPTTYKFALGSVLGAMAIGWALVVEHWIHQAYYQAVEGEDPRISVLWLAPCYILIGWGEIFVVSTAYEVSFKASSPEKKALASAINIFSVGGIPNFICIFLYQACHGWFRNSHGDTNLQHLEDYATAHVAKYFWLLFGVLLFGIVLNLMPAVSRFVQRTEDKAADLLKTPVMKRKTRFGGTSPQSDNIDKSPYYGADEESPLLLTPTTRIERHQNYLKFGKGPVLYKNASMRAGPANSQTQSKTYKVKAKHIHKLYGGADDPAVSGTPLLFPPKSQQQRTSADTKAVGRTHSFEYR